MEDIKIRSILRKVYISEIVVGDERVHCGVANRV